MTKKVRFVPYRQDLGTIMHRQTKGHRLTSLDGCYEFCLDDSIEEADFWVVQGKGIRQPQTCRVAPENTIFLATEPRSVLVYPQQYLNQFGLVVTCQEPTKHPNVHYGPAILPWFVGYKEEADGKLSYSLDYDTLSQPLAQPEKTQLLSVITSNKAFTRGHLDRIRFVEQLKEHFGDRIDVFGRGFRTFDDKWDVLRPYQYHIVIENSSQRYYWTEKISDCFLAETFPIYYGCTNLDDYFRRDAFATIDIRRPDEAIDTIERIIDNRSYELSKTILAQCRQQVLDRWNMFEYIARLCDQLDANRPRKSVTLLPCRSGRSWQNLYNYTVRRNYYQMLTRLHYLSKGNKLGR